MGLARRRRHRDALPHLHSPTRLPPRFSSQQPAPSRASASLPGCGGPRVTPEHSSSLRSWLAKFRGLYSSNYTRQLMSLPPKGGREILLPCRLFSRLINERTIQRVASVGKAADRLPLERLFRRIVKPYLILIEKATMNYHVPQFRGKL